MKEIMIEEIYNNMIEFITYGIDDKKTIEDSYKSYLKRTYNESYENEKEFKKKLEYNINFEKTIWKTKETLFKLSELVEDEYLNQLQKLSIKCYNLAIDKKEKNIRNNMTKEEVFEFILNMKEITSKCLDFNTTFANVLLSEGIIDILYSTDQIDVTSSRIDLLK